MRVATTSSFGLTELKPFIKLYEENECSWNSQRKVIYSL